MKKINSIAESFAELIATWNPLYLIEAFYLIIVQRRFIEVIYGVYCRIKSPPSVINTHSGWSATDALDEDIKQLLFSVKDIISREEIIHIFGQDYSVRSLPRDFSGARMESIIIFESLLIIGEYGDQRKRIAIVSQQSCLINEYYKSNNSVRHIHSICNASDAGLILVSTGDTAKFLDLWEVRDGNMSFIKHLRKSLAGYSAMLRVGCECMLGTDFAGRPNYLEFFSNKKKISLPEKSYKMYVKRLIPYKKRYILCLSRELTCMGGRYALSVFDVVQEVFIFCDYVQYINPETVNKALHRKAITLRSIAYGELRH